MSAGAELYPAIGYEISSGGASLTVSVTRTSGTVTTSHTISSSTRWGITEQVTWTDSGSYSDDWLHLAVSQAIAAHADITAVAGAYAETGYAYPRCTHTVTFAAGNPVLSWYIEGGTTVMRALGFHGTPGGGVIRINGVGSTVSTTGFHSGIWAPMVPWTDIEVEPGYIAQQAISPFDASKRTVVELGARSVQIAQWRIVPMRDITEVYARQTAAAAVAGTSTADTYGTLERLVDAVVGSSRDLRLITEDGTGYTCTLQWERDLSTADLAEREESRGGRRYTVTMPLLVQP